MGELHCIETNGAHIPRWICSSDHRALMGTEVRAQTLPHIAETHMPCLGSGMQMACSKPSFALWEGADRWAMSARESERWVIDSQLLTLGFNMFCICCINVFMAWGARFCPPTGAVHRDMLHDFVQNCAGCASFWCALVQCCSTVSFEEIEMMEVQLSNDRGRNAVWHCGIGLGMPWSLSFFTSRLGASPWSATCLAKAWTAAFTGTTWHW